MTFLVPDGGRSEVPEDQLRYQFTSPHTDSILSDSASGIGDATLELTYMGERQRDLQIAYAVGYKASTGDSSEWTGSGSSDLYGVARFSGAHRSELPLYWHGQLGLLRWATVLYLVPNSVTGFGLVGSLLSGILMSDGR